MSEFQTSPMGTKPLVLCPHCKDDVDVHTGHALLKACYEARLKAKDEDIAFWKKEKEGYRQRLAVAGSDIAGLEMKLADALKTAATGRGT
jgi:hypothetical protein